MFTPYGSQVSDEEWDKLSEEEKEFETQRAIDWGEGYFEYLMLNNIKPERAISGSEFKKWRTKNKITQQDVAKAVKCNNSTISRWETGGLFLRYPLYLRIFGYYWKNKRRIRNNET